MGSVVTRAPGTGAIRFRSTLGQWFWAFGFVSGAFVLTQGALALAFGGSAGGSSDYWVSSTVEFILLWAVGTAFVYRWQGVTLSPAGLRVHSLSPRVIRWSDIEGFSLDRLFGITYIMVRETSGRYTRLRAPSTGLLAWDRDFDAKCRTIEEWHHALR